MPNDGLHQAVLPDRAEMVEPLLNPAYASVVGGPDEVELTAIGQDLARAYATHDMPPGALSALLGGLMTVARGPHGVASQAAMQSLQNAQRAVNHR